MDRALESHRDDHWTFLTNHAHVLLCIARDPGMRLKDVAQSVGITERAAQRIVADLVAGGYLERDRIGRRNQYEVHRELHFRHPLEERETIGSLLDILAEA
jgi:DNA-binding MarR family transcriptional regulator